jgi:hypothetical protein
VTTAPTSDNTLTPRLGEMYRRLSGINWQRLWKNAQWMDEADTEYAKSLVLSYRANMGTLADELRTDEVNPFLFNFARFIDGDMELPRLVADWLAEFRSHLYTGRGSWSLAEMFEAALSWEALEDKNAVSDAVMVRSPYEPLIQFFELGGTFYEEHRLLWQFSFGCRELVGYMMPRVGKSKEKRKMKER